MQFRFCLLCKNPSGLTDIVCTTCTPRDGCKVLLSKDLKESSEMQTNPSLGIKMHSQGSYSLLWRVRAMEFGSTPGPKTVTMEK